jgi:hypothetical protein
MFVMQDPIDNRTLMYTASWDAGLHIVDISNPANPVQVGAWNDYPDGHTGNLHTVATEWIGERRITVGAVEVGFQVVGGVPYYTDAEASVVYVWDSTDAAAIRLLGTWTNPWGYTPGASSANAYSTHNLQLEQGRVYLAHYGLGIWVLDVSTPERQAAPMEVAFQLGIGSVWDVIVHQGVMFSSGSGVQPWHFLPDTLGADGIHSRA